MKKMLRGFALILALTLAATLCIPAFAAEGATESERNIELPTDEVLLATVQDNIDAYAEYYFLHSVTVIDKFVSKYENDSYDVDFIHIYCDRNYFDHECNYKNEKKPRDRKED